MKKQIIAYLFLISVIMTSCLVYNPQPVDIPLINKKKDLRIDGGISVVPSAHATISYGLTDKISIQTFGSIGSDERMYFQGAVGYFKNLSNQKVMELYGGFGYGYGNAYKDANPGNLYGDYQIYFTQFNFGKVDCKNANLDYGLGFKVGYLYTTMTDKNYYEYYSEFGPFQTYKDNSFLIEPSLFARFGKEKLKFNIMLGSCLIYKFTNTENYLPYSYVNLSLGFNYRF